MIIFLYGPDGYRREAKKREIVAEFQKKRSDLGIGRFSAEGGSASGGDFSWLEELREFLVNQSLFQSVKMAVVENSFQVVDDRLKVELKGILKEVLDSKNITVLISEPVRRAQGKNWGFLKRKPVISQEFSFLEGREWEGFILNEAKRLGVKITPTALKFLSGVYQNNTWALITELEKVAGLNRETVDVGDLEDLGVEQRPNFWSLIFGFKSRDLPQKLWALEKILGSNEPPAKIFNILAYQLPDKLKKMAEYDLMVKSGKIEYEEALVDLVI